MEIGYKEIITKAMVGELASIPLFSLPFFIEKLISYLPKCQDLLLHLDYLSQRVEPFNNKGVACQMSVLGYITMPVVCYIMQEIGKYAILT